MPTAGLHSGLQGKAEPGFPLWKSEVQKGQEAITLLTSLPGALCHSLWGFLLLLGIHLGQDLCIFQWALCSSHSPLLCRFMWASGLTESGPLHSSCHPWGEFCSAHKLVLPSLRYGGSHIISAHIFNTQAPGAASAAYSGALGRFILPQLLNHLLISWF